MQQSKNMNEPENKSPAIPASPQAAAKFLPVKFVHEKGPQFRTYHVDGQWGVIDSQNQIHLNFFTEFPKFATGVVHQVNQVDGNYTGEFNMQGIPDPDYNVIIRDFQCGIVLSVATAERFRGLLDTYIQMVNKNIADQKGRQEQKK